ncbi:putative RNA-binding protein 15B [Branchiostoma floridae x Branchiostoma japonicum]
MKRQQDRETPTKSKRSRSSAEGRDRSSRDRGSPDHEREGRGNSKVSSRSKDRPSSEERTRDKRSRDDRSYEGEFRRSSPNAGKGDRLPDYRSLCVSNFGSHLSESAIRDGVFHEFKKYGEINVKVGFRGDERVAYVNFRFPQDAKDAKKGKLKLVLFDRSLRVEPVFSPNKYTLHTNKRERRSLTPEFSSPSYPASQRDGRSPVPGRRVSTRHGSLTRDLPPRERFDEFDPGPRGRLYANNDRYPYDMLPEDDQRATRTLFVGNLEYNISDTELRRAFEPFGYIEDIDIKRPMRGQGNAYAFVKFTNLDVAHKAKLAMQGQPVGRNPCKIGYGKALPTTCLWVGGLGPWTSLAVLEREFDRFGAIRKIDYVKGDNHAYILYDSLDAAQAAWTEMRGFPLGGPDRRLRVDFADPEGALRYPAFPPDRRPPGRDELMVEFDHRDLDRRGSRGLTPPPMYANRGNSFDDRAWHDARRGGFRQFDGRGDHPRTRDDWQDRNNGGIHRDMRDWEQDRSRSDGLDGGRNSGSYGDKRRRSPMDNFDSRDRDQTPERNRKLQQRSRSRSPRSGSAKGSPNNRDRVRYTGYVSPDRRGYSPNRKHSVEDNSPKGARDSKRRHSQSSEDRFMDRNDNDDRDRIDKDHKTHRHGRRLDSAEERAKAAALRKAENLNEVAKHCSAVWNGALVLKNSAFGTKMHHLGGDSSIVESLLLDRTAQTPVLKITQRLRLDMPKLEEVTRRIESSGMEGHCLLLALPSSGQFEDPTLPSQQRPLRNLVSYLKQKQAAGVISLPVNGGKDKNNVGVLHAFPPCQFSQGQLRRLAPNLPQHPSPEDHLVVIIVRGCA